MTGKILSNSRVFGEFSLKNILPNGVHREVFPLTFSRASAIGQWQRRESARFSPKVTVLHCKRRLAMRHFLAVSRRAHSLGILEFGSNLYISSPSGATFVGGSRDIYRGSGRNQILVIPRIKRLLLCVRSTVADATPRAMLGSNSHVSLTFVVKTIIRSLILILRLQSRSTI